MRCLALFASILLFSLPCLAENIPRNPYRTKVSNIHNFLNARIGDRFKATINTSEGNHTISFSRISPAYPRCLINGTPVPSTKCTVPSLKLFRGKIVSGGRFHAAVRGASADIIDNSLRINFHGRRGRRIYLTKQSLTTTAKPNSAALRQTPLFKLVQCGLEFPLQAAARLPASTSSVISPAVTLEIATDADGEFYAANGDNTNAQIQAILNTAEAIYLAQIGVDFSLTLQNVFTDSSIDPYTQTAASDLLDEFKAYSEEQRHLGPRDVAHLFTGKDIDSSVVGFAFTGVICKSLANSYGFTQLTDSAIQALVTAHEIGHNFNASHDDSSPPSIMASSSSPEIVNSNPSASQFSDFSINEITSFITENSSCLNETAPPFTDLPTFSKLQLKGNGDFILNIGSSGGQGCTLTVQIIDGNTTYTLKSFTVTKTEAKKEIVKLMAKGVKINPTALPQFVVRIKKECSGFETALSDDDTGVVVPGTKSGAITTIPALATQIVRNLKKVKKKKKRTS